MSRDEGSAVRVQGSVKSPEPWRAQSNLNPEPRTLNPSPMPRLARYVISHGWMHLILLVGVCIFIFPFIWLFFTSVKTDDEVTSKSWIPSIPTFRAQSP